MATSNLPLLMLAYLQLFLYTGEASRFVRLNARAATPIITAAPSASSISGLANSNNLLSKRQDTQTATITLKIAQPSRCLQSDFPYSSKFSVPLGNVHIFADNTTGWGETGSVWNFTASDDVQMNFTTNTNAQVSTPCEGLACFAGQQSGQPLEPTDTFIHNADGSWYATTFKSDRKYAYDLTGR